MHYRLVVQPTKALTKSGVLPINASLKDLRAEIDQGYKDGIDAAEKMLNSPGQRSNLDDFMIDALRLRL